MKQRLFLLFALLSISKLFSLEITQLEPPNWWSGMEHDTLKILVYGDDFTGWDAQIRSKNVTLLAVNTYPNTHYMGLELKIKKSGNINIVFKKDLHEDVIIPYSIKQRNDFKINKLSPGDVVYLLMPDRFADGDKTNNLIEGHLDPIRPEHQWGRRGGDLQGVIDHLDYLEELGITALWMTPIYENNYINCYHGYTPTNSYKVDPHLGDLETYQELVTQCHQRNIKIIQDHIVNHISPTHPLAIEPPSKEWLNGSPEEHEVCNYRIMDITDIYGSPSKHKLPIEGWFAGYLADMNMAHDDVVDYYIHHAIWWIETMKLDGIREDTYAYSDLAGLSRWAKELKREYPDLFIVGEIMDFDRTRLSYYFNAGTNNYLSSIADFGFSSEIYQLIVEYKSIDKFYQAIANDFIYRDPNMMLTFMDNHDMGRFYSAVNSDIQRYLNAFTLIFSMRGLPQLYYGDEIGMLGGYDPNNRDPFPGGFNDVYHNAFTKNGRSEIENRIFDQMKAFIQLRHSYPEMFKSRMQHDLQNDIYLVSRKDPASGATLLMAYNPQNKTQDATFSRIVNEEYEKYSIVKSPTHGKVSIDLQKQIIVIPPGEAVLLILE